MEQQKLAALTFDDGPMIGITDQVLDILEENDVKASFFLIGQQITEETEYLVKRAYDMGCSIENHSLTHASMPTLSPEEIKAEIDETTRRIEKITGEKPEFFRPPFIDYDQKMYDAIDLPFICAYGCEDWEPSVSAGERIKRVLEAARPGYMVLLHDMKDNEQTVEAIKTIIPELKKQGYELVSIRELFRRSGVKPERNVIYMSVDEVRENTPEAARFIALAKNVLHTPYALLSGTTVLRYTLRKKTKESVTETISAIRKHHHTLLTLPVRDRSHAAGISTTS